MLTAEKQILLSGFLGRLPEHVAARLAKAVEVDRLIGGTTLPHDEILRALRPQLRQVAAPQRTETPQRLFCRPFEDLFTDAERKAKQKGRIARGSVEPIWNWLANDLMPARHGALTDSVRKAMLERNESEVEARVAELHRESAEAMKAALADLPDAAQKLGSRLIAEDAAEIALLVGAAGEIAKLQRRLPKPIAVLSEDDNNFLRDAYDRLTQSDPDIAPYVALIVMGRLERRWEALKIAATISRKSTDTLISNTDLGIVGELLFSDLDFHARKIQTARPNDFDCDAVLSHLAAFAELSSGMVKEFGIRRDGKWGHQLAKARGDVAQTMETLLERAPKDIFAALPPAKPGGFGKGPKPLDFSRPPDAEKIARAMRFAQLLVHSRPFSVAAAFSAKLNEIIDQVAVVLRSTSEDVLRETRDAAPDALERVRQHFQVALDLCELILGEEESDFLRRRARVTKAAAVA